MQLVRDLAVHCKYLKCNFPGKLYQKGSRYFLDLRCPRDSKILLGASNKLTIAPNNELRTLRSKLPIALDFDRLVIDYPPSIS